jgi:OTU domain-containing protein 6
MLLRIEAEYDAKLKEMQARHRMELLSLRSSTEEDGEGERTNAGAEAAAAAKGGGGVTIIDHNSSTEGQPLPPPPTTSNDSSTTATNNNNTNNKKDKARRRRERQRAMERERDERVALETAKAGPSPRDVELAQIQQILDLAGLTVQTVAADGHCLYRAIAAQLNAEARRRSGTESGAAAGDDAAPAATTATTATATYQDVRNWTADALREHADEYAPFCEYNSESSVPHFPSYVAAVRNTATWGGHLELRALAQHVLHRPLEIYSAATTTSSQQQPMPLRIECDDSNDNASPHPPPIRLSYHLRYYALGEHYNCVVEKE